MDREVTRITQDVSQAQDTLLWMQDMILRGLRAGPVLSKMTRPDDGRTNDQNAKLWACLRDVSKQMLWPNADGEMVRLDEEEWKDMFSAALGRGRSLPGIGGGYFVVAGLSTSKMSKSQFSQLIELIHAFGADNRIAWSDPALKTFEEYM